MIVPTPTLIESHKSRVGFERVAGYGLAALVFLYGGIGLWSKEMAERVIALVPALSSLATVLGVVMGASWFRGHMDERLGKDG